MKEQSQQIERLKGVLRELATDVLEIMDDKDGLAYLVLRVAEKEGNKEGLWCRTREKARDALKEVGKLTPTPD